MLLKLFCKKFTIDILLFQHTRRLSSFVLNSDSILKPKLTRPGWPLLILLISEIIYDLISIEVRHRLLRPPNNNYSEPPSGGSDFSTFEFPSIFCYFNIWSKLTDWKLFHKIEWLIVGELNVFCRPRFKILLSPEGSDGIFLDYILLI